MTIPTLKRKVVDRFTKIVGTIIFRPKVAMTYAAAITAIIGLGSVAVVALQSSTSTSGAPVISNTANVAASETSNAKLTTPVTASEVPKAKTETGIATPAAPSTATTQKNTGTTTPSATPKTSVTPSCGATCPDKADKTTPATEGALVLSGYEFTMYTNDNLRDAFTAKAASGAAIGLVSKDWSAVSTPINVGYTSDDPTSTPPSAQNSWDISISTGDGQTGDFNVKVSASDGTTRYSATILVHVLAR